MTMFSSSGGRRAVLPLTALIREIRSRAEDLERTEGSLLASVGLTPFQRAILLDLRKLGPSTVPRLARHRGHSRQYVQVSINPLAERGWVVFQPNPAHKTSRLAVLNPAGEEVIRRLMHREGERLREMASGLSAEDLQAATAVLRRLGSLLAIESASGEA